MGGLGGGWGDGVGFPRGAGGVDAVVGGGLGDGRMMHRRSRERCGFR